MIKSITAILILISATLFLTDSLRCQETELLIKVINETDSTEELYSNSTEADKEIAHKITEANFSLNKGLISDSTLDVQNHILLKDDPGNYEEKAELFRKESIKLDRKKISQELYDALLNSFENCKTLTNNKTKNYILYFSVKETWRTDTGETYAWKVDYRVVKEGKIFYENRFSPARKKIWFSNKEYHQFVRPKIIAQQIVADLCKYF